MLVIVRQTYDIFFFSSRRRHTRLRRDWSSDVCSSDLIPREKQPFIVVVAPPGDEPNIEKIKAFITNGEQGINYARGVWHFPLISLGNDNQFITIDRRHNGPSDTLEQCVVFPFDEVEINLKEAT